MSNRACVSVPGWTVLGYMDVRTQKIEPIVNTQEGAETTCPRYIVSGEGNYAVFTGEHAPLGRHLYQPRLGDRVIVPVTSELRARQLAEIEVSKCETGEPPFSEASREQMHRRFRSRDEAVESAEMYWRTVGCEVIEVTRGWIEQHHARNAAEGGGEGSALARLFTATQSSPMATRAMRLALKRYLRQVKGDVSASTEVAVQWTDREGKPLSIEEWTARVEDASYALVKIDRVFTALDVEVMICTLWVGVDMGDGCVFRTFATLHFDHEPTPVAQYDIGEWTRTESEALAKHSPTTRAPWKKAQRFRTAI